MDKYHFCGKISVLVLFAILMGMINGQENKPFVCESIIIDCVCGESLEHVILNLKQEPGRYSETGEIQCSTQPDIHQATVLSSCANISCSLAPNGEVPITGVENFISNFFPREFTIPKESAGPLTSSKNFISHFYPQVFNVLKGDTSNGHRFTREDEPCHVSRLKNANIKCWNWPNWRKCEIKCIQGYALQSGDKTVNSMSISCRSSENTWQPNGFMDCLPYMNCQAQLVKPGKLDCKQPIEGPAYCDISCHAHEHYEAIMHQRYECVDDNFSRILPHCAVLNEYVVLINKPQKIEETPKEKMLPVDDATE